MERVFRYKRYVKKADIDFEGDHVNSCFRYLLKVPLRNKGKKKVLAIMKNPSKANKKISDLTINRVLKFCNNEGYSEVYIMNLYSYYSTDPNKIAKLYAEGKRDMAIGSGNDSIMKDILPEVNDVIVAWGSDTFGYTDEYKNRIRQVINIIKGKNLYYVQENNGQGWYPRHAQVWHVNKGIKKYPWTPPDRLNTEKRVNSKTVKNRKSVN